MTTASLEALRKYADGVRAFEVDGDHAKAVNFFREAVAIDTAFGMAYRKLGVALGNAGMGGASRDSALEAAYRHRLRMTDVERYVTIGSYFLSGKRENRKLAADAYEALLQIDSLHPAGLNNLSIILIERREFARAEALLKRGVTAGDPRATMFVNLAETQVRQGRFAAADSTAAAAMLRYPQNAAVRYMHAMTLIGQKAYDSVEALAARARINDPDANNRARATYLARDIAFTRGRVTEGLRLTEEAYSIEEGRGIPRQPFASPTWRAWVDIWYREQFARGAQILDAARAGADLRSIDLEDRQYLDFAELYAFARRPDRARAVLAEYDAAVRDTTMRRQEEPKYRVVLAELALSEKRPLDAIREFRLSDRLPDGPVDVCAACFLARLARAFDAAGMTDSAIVTYERYVALPSASTAPDDYALAPAHLRLGELYDARSDSRKAIPHYRRFIELWKNADPELQPKVARARARLSALGRR